MHFLEDSIKRFQYYKSLGDKTFEQLTDAELLYTPSEESNSIAMIVQHLYGNMLSRWTNFLTEDGEKEWRKRDGEFIHQDLSKQDVLSFWNEGWSCLFKALESLQETDLHKTITIRSEPILVYDAILRQLAHYPYHVGQIVYIGKICKDADWKTLSIAKNKSKEFNEKMGHIKH
ncbi:MAG: DUF1572 family protein [Chitinophagaceae bacterium]|jgi:Protein of unknown function (DUF1572)